MRTGNGDWCYDSTKSAVLEFFAKAGSLLKGRGTFYANEAKAIDLFKPSWKVDPLRSMKLAFWLRDCRGGAGNRSGFRDVIGWLGKNDPAWMSANMHLIPMVGRWDDLKALVGTPCEDEALGFWIAAIMEGHGLAAKWAPREKRNKELYAKLRRTAGMSPKDFRKLLVKNTDVVETAMCAKSFENIDYNKVPSVAMGRYNNAFRRNDAARFDGWKGALAKGVDEQGNKVKINASVLFPHDVIRTLYADLSDRDGGYYGFSSYGRSRNTNYQDSEIANAQFAALPNYMEDADMRIMPICDFSGSMSVTVSGSIQALHVSMGLGLYCSDRVGESNPFYRKFMPFSNDSRLVDWRNDSFSVAAQKYNDGYCGSTNIVAALDKILECAMMFNATNDQIPNMLLIISDMQFNSGTQRSGRTSVEAALEKWLEAGYSLPKIVYWNTAGYQGDPATSEQNGVALVSGFSPSILKAILGAPDFNPMTILDMAIDKYEVVVPD